MGATIRVPGDQPTMQAGVDAAAVGDTVVVAPGTYAGPGNRDIDFGGKNLVLCSEAGYQSTIIDLVDPAQEARGFIFENGETEAAVVDGFTIQNADVPALYGGGLRCIGSSPSFRNCRFADNRANRGGAIHCSDGANPRLSSCSFSGNVGLNEGGGLYCFESSPVLTDCTFVGNGSPRGAGAYLRRASPDLVRCSFSSNVPPAIRGAGVYCTDDCTPHLTDCEFVHLTISSEGAGAGMYCTGLGAPELVGCTFTGNLVLPPSDELGYGGGMCCENGVDAVLSGCTFTGNTAPKGGGVCVRTGACVTLTDCDFSENTGDGPWGAGGGLLSECYTLTGCTFTANIAKEGGGVLGGGAMVDCHFEGNMAVGSSVRGGGAVFGSPSLISGCTFVANSSTSTGGALDGSSQGVVEECTFAANHAGAGGGAVYLRIGDSGSFTGCVFSENSASQGAAALTCEGAIVAIEDCTFYGNSTGLDGCVIGAQQYFSDPGIAEVSNAIVAFNDVAEPVTCGAGGVVTLSCSDLFGNTGGDWVGCIADQYGITGNFSDHPMFCNPLAGDLTLAEDSPCAPAHSPLQCGLIGALPVGCAAPIGVADEVAPASVSGGVQVRVSSSPLGPAGTIEWFTEENGAVVLRLFDARGRLVRRHDLGPRVSGVQRVRWGELTGGEAVASGIYFLVLEESMGARGVQRIVFVR
jgi:hypothetical protein